MAGKGISKQVIHILDEDLQEILGTHKIQRSKLMGAFGDYLKDEDLLNLEDKREFFPDPTIKAVLKRMGIKVHQVMPRSVLLKLTGGVAMERGLVEY